MKKQKIILALIFIFVIANAAGQNDQLLAQLIDYNRDTQQSKLHIQNTAGFDLTELDLYINGIRTGRIANKLADGKAVLYFQTITPGTYDVTIKTKEGIETEKQITFRNVKQTLAKTETTRPKTASQLAQDPKYQEFLDEQKKEQEVRQQRQQQELEQLEPEILVPQQIDEEREAEELPKTIAKKTKYSTAALTILILIFLIYIFLIIKIFNRKRR